MGGLPMNQLYQPYFPANVDPRRISVFLSLYECAAADFAKMLGKEKCYEAG
jgi:hypothetical protein